MKDYDPETMFKDVIDPDDPSLDKYKDIADKVDFECTPSNLRMHFLRKSAPLIDEYIDVALGRATPSSTNAQMQNQVWDTLKQIILSAKNPAPIVDLRGKVVSDQIDEILLMATKGKCTLDEAKELMSLVQQGYELNEIPELMKQFEKLTAIGAMR